MKKIIIRIAFLTAIAVCFLPFASLSQVDTANFEFKASGSDGKYTMLTNRGVYLGKAAGEIVTPIQFMLASIDTANWLFIPIGSDGTYRLVENKAAFMGKDSGTVRAQIVTGIQTIGTVTTSSGTATLNSAIGKVTTDNATGNETATITINNNLFTANSVILVTAFIQDAISDAMVFISQIDPDNHFFTIKVSRVTGGTFLAEQVIFFQIIN